MTHIDSDYEAPELLAALDEIKHLKEANADLRRAYNERVNEIKRLTAERTWLYKQMTAQKATAASKTCRFPDCDGGFATGFCHTDCDPR